MHLSMHSIGNDFSEVPQEKKKLIDSLPLGCASGEYVAASELQ